MIELHRVSLPMVSSSIPFIFSFLWSVCIHANGAITSQVVEIRKMAVNFHATLNSKEPCDSKSTEELFHDFPKLADEQKKMRDNEITFKDLKIDIDGLPDDFYQQFWNVAGVDLYEVHLSCFKEKSLPLSCQYAVLSLLPKKGDLL